MNFSALRYQNTQYTVPRILKNGDKNVVFELPFFTTLIWIRDISAKLTHKRKVYFCCLKWRGEGGNCECRRRLPRALPTTWVLPGIQTALDQGGTTSRRHQDNPLSSACRSGERNYGIAEMPNGARSPPTAALGVRSGAATERSVPTPRFRNVTKACLRVKQGSWPSETLAVETPSLGNRGDSHVTHTQHRPPSKATLMLSQQAVTCSSP